jgi:Flp pilus assembly protein TadG
MIRRSGRVRGQALAEFALVVPVFLIILFAIIDLGRFVYTANALSNGAREAARVGSVGSRPTECNGLSRQACIERIARDRSWGVAGTVTTTVTCERVALNGSISTIATASCRTGDMLRVRAHMPFAPATPVVGQILNGVQVSGETRVTVNQ